jgi:putative serine protease PepD
MTPPKHLWSGDWRHESDLARQEAERTERLDTPERPAEAASAPPPPPPPPAAPATRVYPATPPPADEPEGKKRHKGLIATGVVVGVIAIAGGAYAVGTSGDDGSGASTTAANKALPAITGAPVPQKTGQSRAAAIYAKASPAVVSIRTTTGSGTGFLIDKKGTLVTNAHVVEGSKQVQIKFGVHGTTLTGTVKGVDQSSDLAVVDLPDNDVPSGVTPLSLADSRTANVGDDVIAIGNPFGLDRTETTGIVSGIARDIPAPNGFQISEAIQTDASINPGNSGGPLLNAAGNVIGVNSQIETAGSSGSVGVGFAVPSNLVRQVVPGLEKGETITHAWLGVSVGEVTSGSGALVGTITAGGPASAAGLREGDVVTSIDGTPTPDASSLTSTINGKQAGAKVKLKVRRGSETTDVTVTLGNRPAKAATPSPTSPTTP